jgi:hypothetical protein
MDLNGLTDAGEVLQPGRRLKVPGTMPLGSVVLPPAKPLAPELEYVDYGAYTTYEVTYTVEGSTKPLFENAFSNAFR